MFRIFWIYMPFKAFLNKKFDTTHENVFFDELIEKFSKEWNKSNNLVVLLGNFYFNNRDIDAMVIKNDAIIVIDFKDYGGTITFSENDEWKATNIPIKGGAAINPFIQLKTTKSILIKFFENKSKQIFNNNNKTITYNDLYSLVLFHREINLENELPGNIKKWFFISDRKRVVGLINNIVNKTINLTNDEIERIPYLLEIKEYKLIDDSGATSNSNIDNLSENKTNAIVELTVEQEKIKRLDEGRHVVFAPPGAGKTTLLAERIAFALSNGIAESEIICLTFTKRAARNMVEKVNSIVINNNVFIGSFHNFGLRFLETNELIDSNTSILDEEEVGVLIQESIEECKKNDDNDCNSLIDRNIIEMYCDLKKQKDLNLPQNVIDYSSNRFERRLKEKIDKSKIDIDNICIIDLLDSISNEYQKLKDMLNGIDYNDILNMTLSGLNNTNILKMCNYNWLQADEIQDLNTIQWEIFHRLANNNAHIVLFGDKLQAIYGFMGANSTLFLDKVSNFTKHYLKTNFRSPSNFIDFYNLYIEKNFDNSDSYRIIPHCQSNKNDDDIYFRIVESAKVNDEINSIVYELIPQVQNNLAILLRNNKDVDLYSSALNSVGIQHFKISSKDLFKKSDVVNLISIIGVMVTPKNRLYWTRIFSLILEEKIKKCREMTIDIFKSVPHHPFSLFKKDFNFNNYPRLKLYQQELEKFKSIFKDFLEYFLSNSRRKIKLSTVFADIANIMSNLGMINDFDFDDDLEKIVKYLNHTSNLGTLQTIVSSEFHQFKSLNEPDLILDGEKIVVSTIHKAKGLEWDTVVVPQCNNSVFPSYFDKTKTEKDESARVLFVAITRARKQLILSFYKYNNYNKVVAVSPFLADISNNIHKKIIRKVTLPNLIIENEERKKKNNLQLPANKLVDFSEKLYSMIGLSKAKEQISNIILLAQFLKQRENNGKKTSKSTLHLVFAGNPGTGKTTVARMVGEIYKKIGFLSKGHLVETDRGDLVAEYVGHTAIKTKKKVEEAKGGVLFIDEAYSLNSGSNNDFGNEAIETLLKLMEDYREDLIVIVAGYLDKMDEFINSNPGLQSRFSKVVQFEDYSSEELTEILQKMAGDESFKFTDAALIKSNDLIRLSKKQGKLNGNARSIRNLFDNIKQNMAKRISRINKPSIELLNLIVEEDIPEEL